MLWWLEGSAPVDLGGLTPTVLAILVVLCGGMGTGPLCAAGVSGSIALGLPSLVSTEEVKQRKEAHND